MKHCVNSLIKSLLLIVAMALFGAPQAGAESYLEDLTGDGIVDVGDLNLIINEILTGSVVYDVNGDGAVDVTEVNFVINGILNPTPYTPVFVSTFEVNGVKFRMVEVLGGTFTMGATAEQADYASNEEKPAHEVTLKGFAIGLTEVTQELWLAVMGSNPSKYSSANGYSENLQRPVENVSWDDCWEFIAKLNELTGESFSLPTEAQWEYAARGGHAGCGYMYAGSNNLNDVAWYWKSIPSTTSGMEGYGTQSVGTKKPNEIRLLDMSGNVWEWCIDYYGSYSADAVTDPTGPTSGLFHVYRGGSWYNSAGNCRVSYRNYASSTYRDDRVGLRLVVGGRFLGVD